MCMSRIEKFFANSPRRQRSRVALAQRLLDIAQPEPGQALLEVGCGVGTVSGFAARSYHLRVTGVDVDLEQLGRAKARGDDLAAAEFAQADGTRLPFPDASFDLALSFMVMHHVPDPPSVLQEVHRVLKPSGLLILADIFLYWPIGHLGVLVGHDYSLPGMGRFKSILADLGYADLADQSSLSLAGTQFRAVYRRVG